MKSSEGVARVIGTSDNSDPGPEKLEIRRVLKRHDLLNRRPSCYTSI